MIKSQQVLDWVWYAFYQDAAPLPTMAYEMLMNCESFNFPDAE